MAPGKLKVSACCCVCCACVVLFVVANGVLVLVSCAQSLDVLALLEKVLPSSCRPLLLLLQANSFV